MATPEDIKADAEHIRMADQFIEVPGGTNTNNYGNVQLIVSAAIRTGVDAVWPGWGHASEKPELPEALSMTPNAVRFVGPPAGPMAALGDKVGSTILAQAAGVPTLPWSGDGVAIAYSDCPGGVIPEDIYSKACVRTLKEALDCCSRIGYPAMLKASWGGGGKGIRRVMNEDDVKSGFRQVQGEVPGSPIFVMKLAPQSRHLEVQLLCDMHGNVCSVFSRDCSIQRRHQKIVEEGPVTAASQSVLDDMEKSARALARSVGYVGAATVEYLYALESKEYCFLELNPRLQVEHPVTEWISGVNIPATQLLIAAGVPLHRIPDIRRMYGLDPAGDSPIDFENLSMRLPPAGHVMAVRVTAENANNGFKPTAGVVDEISFRSTPDVWGYFSVKSGGAIHEYSDSQFGHLFAKGDTRDAAIRAMVVALKEIKIRGEIRTPVDYVCDMIQTPDFVGDLHHTGWLDARIAAQVMAGKAPWELTVVCGALLRAKAHVNSRSAEYLSYLERGQLPPSRLSLVSSTEEFVVDNAKYRVKVSRTGPQAFRLTLNSTSVGVVARRLNDGGLLVQVDGEAHVVHWEDEAMGTRLVIDSATALLSNEHDPSRLLAISTGKLVRFLVEDGAHVEADQPYAEIEVMKMVMPLMAPASGKVHFQLPEGSVMAPGQLIAKLDLDDLNAVRKAELYTDGFPEMGPPAVESDSIAHRFAAALTAVKNILAGYEGDAESAVGALLAALDDPALGLDQWDDMFATVATKLPLQLTLQLEGIMNSHGGELEKQHKQGTGASGGGKNKKSVWAKQLLETMQTALDDAEPIDRTGLLSILDPLMALAKQHLDGRESYAQKVAAELIEEFLTVEEKFESGGRLTEQEIIDELRQAHSSDLQHVLDIVMSHKGAKLKCTLLQGLLSAMVLPDPNKYRPQLRRLAALAEPACVDVAQHAQQLLEHSLLGELQTVVARALSGLDMFPDPSAAEELLLESALGQQQKEQQQKQPDNWAVMRRPTVMEGLYSGLGGLAAASARNDSMEARMDMLVEAPAAVEDALASLLDHPDLMVRQRALVTYIKRIYLPFLLHEPELQEMPDVGGVPNLAAVWAFDCPEPSSASPSSNNNSKERHGGAVVVDSLKKVPQVLNDLAKLRARTGMSGLTKGTLHIVLSSQDPASLALSPEAQKLVRPAAVDGYIAPSDCEDIRMGGGGSALIDPRAVATAAAAQVEAVAKELAAAGYEAVSVLSKRGKLSPLRTVFYRKTSPSADNGDNNSQFELIPVLSLVEPPVAATLELKKLLGFKEIVYSSSRNRQWHVYTSQERGGRGSLALKRVFLRTVIRQLGRPGLLAATYSHNAPATATAAMEEVETALLGSVEELDRIGNVSSKPTIMPIIVHSKDDEIPFYPLSLNTNPPHLLYLSLTTITGGREGVKADWSHLYLGVLSTLPLHEPQDESLVAAALRAAAAAVTVRHGTALRRVAVAQWEVRLPLPDGKGAWRVVVSAPTGHEAGEDCVEVYREQSGADDNDTNDGVVVYRARIPEPLEASLHNHPVTAPYPPLEPLQLKRLAARRHKTTYCYDFPAVFENALRQMWAARALAGEPNSVPPPGKLVTAQELVPSGTLNFRERTPLTLLANRPMARNDVGVVAWLLTLRSPETPQGRRVVAISNDITHASGAFGPREDAMFRAATEYALAEKLPVVYLAANSGARVGLANEVKQCMSVEWVNPDDPTKGFKYLYLSEEDYGCIMERATAAASSSSAVEIPLKAERMVVNGGGVRYKLTDIVGLEDGLGVECLSGSGAIAGIYNQAFRQGFTITMVSGRTVGIGAYLARLGRRCIQRDDQPIILTGYAALNKLLGREVYTSHMQLGGPRVMGTNGVSHHVVEDDLAGVAAVLQWLSYTAPRIGDTLPALPSADPTDRPVTYLPNPDANEKLDPRAAIAGIEGPKGSWVSGMFDKGTWTEAQPGWARTVVTGRARLGGLPVGIIAVEVGTVTLSLPADPGMPDSSERVIPQAGQVWFPDSALKTAQAIEEFDLEGLPLFILANWRGFSGGMRDLFEGVLQSGSLIVDALHAYHRPVFVYLPPGCELRGGAWVVVDSQINANQIEMYADPTAQGGVLEPSGIVEIKFRKPELVATMHRLDPVIAKLKAEGGVESHAAIKAREETLLPIYHQVALQFAQMHDGPARMLAKGVLKGVVPWSDARTFFALRLKRKLCEEALLKHISAADDIVGGDAAKTLLKSWFLTTPNSNSYNNAATQGFLSNNNTTTITTTTITINGEDAAGWNDDACFMSWAEGASGAARIAVELKALRTAAASRTVVELSRTSEGTEGLVRGLQEAVAGNPSLMLQLRSLCK